MKIAILGGTGELGRGLALRWAKYHSIVIGSRFQDKAKALASEYYRIAKEHYRDEMQGEISGFGNLDAAKVSDVLVPTVSHIHLVEFVRSIRASFTEEKLVISPVVPLEKREGSFQYTPLSLFDPATGASRPFSAAEAISLELSSKRVVATLHTVPAAKLTEPGLVLDYDVPLCGDDSEAVKQASKLVKDIPNLRPVYAGQLSNSALLESVVPLLLNISLHSKIRSPSIKVF